MNQLKKETGKHCTLAKGLASVSMAFSGLAANSKCMCIYHQPEKPDALKKLRKF